MDGRHFHNFIVESVRHRLEPTVLRTNNAVEGWHNRFHKAVRMDHPNIYLFVMHLRREQHTLLINLNQAALGYSITGRTSKYDKFQKKINDLFAAHVSGALTSTELVTKVRHLIHVHC